MANNKVGENALESTVRKLEVFNTRFADADVEGMEDFQLVIRKDGSGAVRSIGGTEYEFDSIYELSSFLSAPAARQLQLMVFTCA